MVLDGSGKPFEMVFYVLLKCLQFRRQNFKVTTYFKSPDLMLIVLGLRPQQCFEITKNVSFQFSIFGGKFKINVRTLIPPFSLQN